MSEFKEIGRITIRVIENNKGMLMTDRHLQFACTKQESLENLFNQLNLFKTLVIELEIEKSRILDEIKELEIRTERNVKKA